MADMNPYALIGSWMKERVRDLRETATRFRNAYTQDYMAKPCRLMADAYDDAATLIESRIPKTDEAGQTGRGRGET